jgi:capsular polysaccharide biosynthesis protein
MELGEFLAVAMRRLLLVVITTALAAGAAWYASADDAPTYERTLRYIVHPDETFALDDIPSAVENLEQEGPLMQTVLGVLDSDPTLERAVDTAAVDEVGEAVTLTASIRPGSNLIDCTLRGQDPDVLAAVGDSLTVVASTYVTQTYKGYDLDYLGVEAPARPVPSAIKNAGLAAVVGAFLGITIVFAEALIRSRRRSSLRPDAEQDGEREMWWPPATAVSPWEALLGAPRPPVRMGNGAQARELEGPHAPTRSESD